MSDAEPMLLQMLADIHRAWHDNPRFNPYEDDPCPLTPPVDRPDPLAAARPWLAPITEAEYLRLNMGSAADWLAAASARPAPSVDELRAIVASMRRALTWQS